MPDSGLMLMQSYQIVINISDHKKNEKDTPGGSLLTIMFNYLFRAFIFFIQLFKFLD